MRMIPQSALIRTTHHALINKGQALFQMGRYQDAADAYARADATDPGNSEAAAGLAQAQTAAGAATQTMLIILGVS